jgi:hypothetical protein
MRAVSLAALWIPAWPRKNYWKLLRAALSSVYTSKTV